MGGVDKAARRGSGRGFDFFASLFLFLLCFSNTLLPASKYLRLHFSTARVGPRGLSVPTSRKLAVLGGPEKSERPTRSPDLATLGRGTWLQAWARRARPGFRVRVPTLRFLALLSAALSAVKRNILLMHGGRAFPQNTVRDICQAVRVKRMPSPLVHLDPDTLCLVLTIAPSTQTKRHSSQDQDILLR